MVSLGHFPGRNSPRRHEGHKRDGLNLHEWAGMQSWLSRALCVFVVFSFEIGIHGMTTFRPLQTVTELLCELIAIPSVNPMGRDLSWPIYFEGRLSDWLVKFFESFGADYERIETVPGRDNVIARYNSPDAKLT